MFIFYAKTQTNIIIDKITSNNIRKVMLCYL